ncbi:hypothetical protein ACFLRA_01955 [Bdellovibrionota bacterium]
MLTLSLSLFALECYGQKAAPVDKCDQLINSREMQDIGDDRMRLNDPLGRTVDETMTGDVGISPTFLIVGTQPFFAIGKFLTDLWPQVDLSWWKHTLSAGPYNYVGPNQFTFIHPLFNLISIDYRVPSPQESGICIIDDTDPLNVDPTETTARVYFRLFSYAVQMRNLFKYKGTGIMRRSLPFGFYEIIGNGIAGNEVSPPQEE